MLGGIGRLCAVQLMPRSTKRCRHFACAATFAAALIVHAPAARSNTAAGGQDSTQSLKSLSLEDLGNVEVTSVSKQPEKLQQTAAAVFVIRQLDIERSGATNIPEALRLAPGVEVARVDANHWSVAVRGFAGQFSKSLLVLVDGRSIYTPLFEGVYWDLPYVMLEDVDRIEVIRGPGGTIWGANAVNGVINIITKKADETHGTLTTLGSGTVDQGTGAFRFGAATASGLHYRLYGTGAIRGQEEHPDRDGFDHWRMGQIGFRTDWTHGEKDSFTVQGDTYRGVSGESSFVPSLSPPAESAIEGSDYVSGWDVVARWQHRMNHGSDIQVQAYFDRTNRQNFELGETRNTLDLDLVHHIVLREGQELTWGLGARISPSFFVQTVAGINFLPNQQTDSIYSGFAQYEIPIVPNKFTVTAGTKLERNNFSGFEYEPSLRMLWSPTSERSIWAALTRAVRTPSRQDQDIVFDIFDEYFPVGGVEVPVYFQIQGNPSLKSEQLIGSELGYRQQLNDRLYVDVAGFYNLYDNLQAYGPASVAEANLPNPPPPPASQVYLYFALPYGNVVEGHTVGAEVAPNWKITNWWQLRGAYSYLHMSMRDKPGFSDVGNLLGTYAASSPQHVANFESSFFLPKRLELDGTYRYSAMLPQYHAPGYSTADVRLAWRWREGVSFSLAGQNLLQPFHAEFGGDPGPLVGVKRSVYGKIMWERP